MQQVDPLESRTERRRIGNTRGKSIGLELLRPRERARPELEVRRVPLEKQLGDHRRPAFVLQMIEQSRIRVAQAVDPR
jgi:hypothetical protein